VKVLIDECLPKALGKALRGHTCRTVQQMGWGGIKNGLLLGLAEKQFEAFVTGDRNLTFQQHVVRFKIGLVVLRGTGTKVSDVMPLVPGILEALKVIGEGRVEFVGP
jgi:hypothetical protein